MRYSYTYSNINPTENFPFSVNKAIGKIPHLNFLYVKANHLGNVMVTVTDKKQGVDLGGASTDAEYYMPEVISSGEPFAFGASTPGRRFNETGTEFGFNGKRQDNEIYGEDNSYDFGARMYDPRLGRWLSTDPSESKYPGISTYSFAFNSPIVFNDPDGKDGRLTITPNSKGGGTITLESTIHVYGVNAAAGIDELKSNTAALLGTDRTYTDKDGHEWKVVINVNYVYNESLENMRKAMLLPDSRVRQLSQLTNEQQKEAGIVAGDNILEIDLSRDLGDAAGLGGTAVNGAIIGAGATYKTAIHETLHLLGYYDKYETIGGLTYNYPDFRDLVDPMIGGQSPGSVKLKDGDYGLQMHDIHYYDLYKKALQYLNSMSKVINEVINKPIDNPAEPSAKRIENSKQNTKSPKSGSKIDYGKKRYNIPKKK
ncbi:MAG: RHS repeat-associated core domain-containing protein, partial [Bacteroidia bacterium]